MTDSDDSHQKGQEEEEDYGHGEEAEEAEEDEDEHHHHRHRHKKHKKKKKHKSKSHRKSLEAHDDDEDEDDYDDDHDDDHDDVTKEPKKRHSSSSKTKKKKQSSSSTRKMTTHDHMDTQEMTTSESSSGNNSHSSSSDDHHHDDDDDDVVTEHKKHHHDKKHKRRSSSSNKKKTNPKVLLLHPGQEDDIDIEMVHEDEVDKKKPQSREYHVDDLNGFWERQAKRVARNPCWHLNVCLVVSVALSAIGMIVGEFSVSANTGGWQSRGTVIADRQAQLMLTRTYRNELFSKDNTDIWNDLLDNVQSGWEDDDGNDDDDNDEEDDERRRRLEWQTTVPVAQAETFLDYLRPQADRIAIQQQQQQQRRQQHRQLPFQLTPDMHRRLQTNLEGCDMSWYTPGNLTYVPRLWPVWKTTAAEETKPQSVFDPAILRDICIAESKTQRHLEEQGLCIVCNNSEEYADNTHCLPPFSLVLYARLQVPDGFGLDCHDLAEAWGGDIQTKQEDEWKQCVKDVKAATEQDELPYSCPLGFHPGMIEETFDETGISMYTSSIFATRSEDVDLLYEEADVFDRGSDLVEGAYDTQYEDFAGTKLDESLPSDMALALGSAVVVAIAIIIHTRSPLITIIGLAQIILSFPLSYLVYNLILRLEFFPFLNFIGVFVVFALGAGDVFVAVDKFKNARLEHPGASTEYVAAVALPDAACAMFLTTVTTAVAFFATAICPVAPIKMFAIFCGLLIMFDYIMNVLLVFPALCIYDRSLVTKGHDKVNCCITITCFGLCRPKYVHDEEHQNTLKILDDDDFNPSLIRSILLAFYNGLHYIRWPLLVVCMGALAACIYVASTLDLPTSSDVRLLSEKQQFELNYQWRGKLLSTVLSKEGGSEAFLIWGVEADDTGNLNNPSTWTQLVLDDSFDPSSAEAQEFLADFCNDLFENDFALPPYENYTCTIAAFDEWLNEQSDMILPDSSYTDNCAGASGIPVPQENFDPCIIAWSRDVNDKSILQRNGKVQIILFPFGTRVRFDDPFSVLDDEWNEIEKWMQAHNKKAPSGVNRGFFSNFDFWWYDTNGQMLATAYSAAGIALGCAAGVILFSSRSIVLTLFCTVTIGYVLTSVTATLVAMGWTLGFLEAICFAILIGVSVDFVIHFSHAYATLPGNVDRGRRTKFALIKMGPSLLATAATTILSAIVMLFTVITFFQKFALILFLTVLQASLGSFILFLTMVDCIGPNNPTYLADRLMCQPVEKKDSNRLSRTSHSSGMDLEDEQPDKSKPEVGLLSTTRGIFVFLFGIVVVASAIIVGCALGIE